jgi:uncharacterized protein YyaL (SSP411 family)
MSNRLAAQRSAYLRSAAHQPIHWFPWGDDAFAAAREHDRPVLLDIGAVWCHWCHVMDGESYEDPRLAAFLNDHFVCIKVDRDERPDVDARYQRAVQALTRQGGWPLTAFLTPAGEVFYGGTYFPPDGAHGRPGFRAVLESVLEAYRSRRGQVQSQAEAVRRVVSDDLNETAAGEVSPAMLEEAVAGMKRAFDSVNGGFGRAPKFPHPGAMALLLHRLWDRPDGTARTILDRTLEGMARGGVYDQLGGGFHRYSVDAEWIVPHFEKMSYDNSELLKVYADAYAMLGAPLYEATAQGIVRWVSEVLADPDGGYGASQDADVGLDDDGDYFTWTRDEAAAVLTPAELDVAAAYYDIGTAGEMHHNPSKNVLFVAGTLEAIASRLSRAVADVKVDLERADAKLLAARRARTAPFVDRTRYTNWNAMMASAMLRAGQVFDDADARGHALRTLTRLRDERIADDAVAHTPGGVSGLLDDQVHMASAALDAYEAGAGAEWLDWSVGLMNRVWTDYWDTEAAGLFDTARRRGPEPGLLPARAKPVQDAPTPSPNGVAGVVVARLHEHTGEARWRERGEALIQAFAGRAAELGLYAASYLLAVDWHLSPATHLVIVGEPGDAVADRMHADALATFVPRRVVRRLAPSVTASWPLPPAMAGMLAVGQAPRAYACTGMSCRAPAATAEDWRATLAALRPD